MDLKRALLEGSGGTELFFSPFLGREIKFRPVTNWEMDDAMINALDGVEDDKIIKILVNYNLLKLGAKDRIEVDRKSYSELVTYRSIMDAWLCYHAIKDFEEGVTANDLLDSSIEIHELAARVRSVSVAAPERISKFVLSMDGRLLAALHLDMNVPLVNEAWKATRLQVQFINGAMSERYEVKPDGFTEITSDELDEDALRRMVTDLKRHERDFRREPPR